MIARQGVRSAGRGAYAVGRYGARSASRYGTGLTPSEFGEYRRYKNGIDRGEFTPDDTYIYEVRRGKELEKRYLATTSKRKSQLRAAYKRFREGPKRLTA
jgi:hypothetical protein